MADTTTRRFDSGGPFGHTPGESPPFHAAQVDNSDPGNEALRDDERDNMTRFSGQQDTLNTAGWVGYSDQPGAADAAYRGRDPYDQSTWNGRPYNEQPGMLSRLHEEAAQ